PSSPSPGGSRRNPGTGSRAPPPPPLTNRQPPGPPAGSNRVPPPAAPPRPVSGTGLPPPLLPSLVFDFSCFVILFHNFRILYAP
ncbi:hypothetical protein AVEN_261187-1, partial [Araneus ventricosus]